MALIDSFPGVSGATDFAELRKLLAGLIVRNADGSPRPGVLLTKRATLITGRTDLKVDVAQFPFITVRNGGVMLGLNDGTVAVPLEALPESNLRIDYLWVKQNISASPTSDATDVPEFGWLQGVPAPIPSAPSLALLPPGAIVVGRVQMASNTTATNDGNKVTISQTTQYTALAETPVPFPALADMKAWTSASVNQRARIDGEDGEWRWDGTRWIPQFPILGLYTWRANVQHQGSELSFSSITPLVRANSSEFASEVFTLGPGGWTAKFDMYVQLSSLASNRIGATPQSLAGRAFWRPKVAGTPVDRLALSTPYELEKTLNSQVLLLRAGEQLSANAYQDTVGTTVTMVLDPSVTYLGPA